MLRPIGDRLVVERFEERTQTSAGLYLPDKMREKPQMGKVLAVGEGNLLETGQRIPLTVKVGDEVLFGKHAGVEVKVDERDYLVLREGDILAILEEGE